MLKSGGVATVATLTYIGYQRDNTKRGIANPAFYLITALQDCRIGYRTGEQEEARKSPTQ